MSGKVTVVGTGPGDSAYISPLAMQIINDAETLVAAQRLLDTFARAGQIQIPISKNLTEIVDYIDAHRSEKRIAVLVSGDTGLFSLADYLVKHMNSDIFEFIPGISAVQLMFARLKRPWNEAQILSLHGRNNDYLPGLVKASPVTAIFTGAPWTAQKIAQYLMEKQIPDLQIALGQNLSYPQERLIYSTIYALSVDKEDYSNCVMVIFNE